MPSNRHSYTLLIIVSGCIVALCCFLFWQKRNIKNEAAKQYEEMVRPRPGAGSTPEQQKALLEALSGPRDSVSPENSLLFRGIPYLMFTRSSPECPACQGQEPPETFCLFPDGRALVISHHENPDHGSLSVGRDEEGNVDCGSYLHKSFGTGSWDVQGVSPRRLVIRMGEWERFHGSVYADADGVLTLEENVPPENGGAPEETHQTHQYKANRIPPETGKFCLLVAPLLDALEIIIPVESVERAVQEMAEKLHIREELLYPLRITSDLTPHSIYLSRRDQQGVHYKLTPRETKTEVVELSSSGESVSEPFLLNTDLSELPQTIWKTERALHELPSTDRENTQHIEMEFLDRNTVNLHAADDPRGMSGSMTTYKFIRQNGRWRLVEQTQADC